MMKVFSGRPNRAAYFVLSIAILAFACEKREDSLGLDLIPEESLLGLNTITDSIQLETYTVLADSARTNELSKALVGVIQHPDFGTTKSSLYMQIRLSALSVDLSGGGDPNAIGLDSLVLSMEYLDEDSLYGKQEPMFFSVKQLSEALDIDSLYYSDHVTEDFGEELLYSTEAITPRPADSTMIYGLTYPPQLRLRLQDWLGENFIEESKLEDSSFDGVSEFLAYFKGLKVSTPSAMGSGSILGLNILSSQSRLTLYYHNAEEDSLSFEFVINENSQRYLEFEHDYTLSPIQSLLDDPDTRDQQLYLQSMAGVNVAVELPSLISIMDTLQGAFNKVEVVLPVSNEMENETFEFPNRMFGVYVNSDDDVISIPDIFEGDLHSDGFYDAANGEYRVNITRFAQQVVTEVIEEPKLRFLPVSNAVSPGWVRLNGVENPMGGAKLVITYTQYE